ncbi:class II aldolase/adducin family protein [Oerskovia sp. KBS0722]|uniref:class II aldolase/adducin family protein n=1 Tax=Oerskovia sp. KBS0722 TaxID=1179673 RepID=UPI00110D6A28|nr:class II aldolase/adducin family protein [Oerskovia sp. KBS0722]QDW63365.1 aldolase [Oerskovia sp. KBS0722]
MTVDAAARTLCAAGRRLVDLGLSPGASGNVSVRWGDRVLVSPTGVPLGALRPDDVSVLDLDGAPVRGGRPSKEVPLHLAMYRRGPEVAAVVHVHSAHAVAYSCLPPWSTTSALPPFTPYLVMRVGQVPLVGYAPPGSDELATRLDDVQVDFRGALLAHHGSIVGAVGLDAAVDAAVEIEEAARVALALHGTAARVLPDDAVRDLADRYGTPWGPRR